MNPKFLPDELTPEMVEQIKNKYEKYGLDIIVTPEELAEECAGDELCERALKDMLSYAVRYANDVTDMKLFVKSKNEYSDDEWAKKLSEIDGARTRLHNTYIDSIKILSRHLHKAERNNDWIKALAPNGEIQRAICGKFAFMLSYWLSVNSRQQ
jgi:hypothetical protein